MSAAVKHQPATPLPWGPEIDAMIAKLDAAILKSEYRKATDDIAGFVQGQRDYIVHASNAYPKLVERTKQRAAFLRLIAGRIPPPLQQMIQEALYSEVASDESLLRDIGEAQ